MRRKRTLRHARAVTSYGRALG